MRFIYIYSAQEGFQKAIDEIENSRETLFLEIANKKPRLHHQPLIFGRGTTGTAITQN